MARSDEDGGDGGDGSEATKALRREEDPHVSSEKGHSKKDKKRKRRKAPPTGSAPSQEHRATSSADDGLDSVNAMVRQRVREIVAMNKKREPAGELLERLFGERDHSVENTFGDLDDGSFASLQARKVALFVSKSVASLSSYAGGKRIRVCSGFVTCHTDTSMILTSATLVRSLSGDNNMVKVLLPDGQITDGHILHVDFHYNVAVVKIAAALAPLEVGYLKDTTTNGAVLALGRAYEGANLMCSRGQVLNGTSTFGCSELLVSSCKVSMAGSGGPLVNYNGEVLGINFWEENQTSHLPMLIVSRILEQHQSFGNTISPWLGLKYTSLQTMPLSVLERIYHKFPDVEEGIYISNVAKGSPADAAGLRKGDVIVECNGKVVSSAPEFGAMLLDVGKEHVEPFGHSAGETMIVELFIKRHRDGITGPRSMAADMLKDSHYNRWPAPKPSYKVPVIRIGS